MIGQFEFIIKEIKNASECIVESVYKHAGIFKNTREVHGEAQRAAECFSHFSSVHENSQAGGTRQKEIKWNLAKL